MITVVDFILLIQSLSHSHSFFSGLIRLFQDVHTIVKNALRLFSQDQTGRADFALESGGQKQTLNISLISSCCQIIKLLLFSTEDANEIKPKKGLITFDYSVVR